MITSLEEDRVCLYAFRALILFAYLVYVTFSVFFSYWCHRSAAGCDCGTPWTLDLNLVIDDPLL